MTSSLKFLFIIIIVLACTPEQTEREEKVIENCGLDISSLIIDDSVTLGNQTWSSRNLHVRVFRNGDSIPFATNFTEWERFADNNIPACCSFNGDSSLDKVYGLLYNWYAIVDHRELAPVGWHIPNNAEWEELIQFLGGWEVAGEAMKNQSGWTSPWSGHSRAGTNQSGFSAIACYSRQSTGAFLSFNCAEAQWWSRDQSNNDNLLACYMECGRTSSVSEDLNSSLKGKGYGLSVRCIKD